MRQGTGVRVSVRVAVEVGISVGDRVIDGVMVRVGSIEAVAVGAGVSVGASVGGGASVALAGWQPETSTANANRSAKTVKNRR